MIISKSKSKPEPPWLVNHSQSCSHWEAFTNCCWQVNFLQHSSFADAKPTWDKLQYEEPRQPRFIGHIHRHGQQGNQPCCCPSSHVWCGQLWRSASSVRTERMVLSWLHSFRSQMSQETLTGSCFPSPSSSDKQECHWAQPCHCSYLTSKQMPLGMWTVANNMLGISS